MAEFDDLGDYDLDPLDDDISSEETLIGSQKETAPYSTIALILGIFSIVTCPASSYFGTLALFIAPTGIITGIPGLIIANKGLKRYKKDTTRYSKGSYANLKAGQICSIIGMGLIIILASFYSLAFIFSS